MQAVVVSGVLSTLKKGRSTDALLISILETTHAAPRTS